MCAQETRGQASGHGRKRWPKGFPRDVRHLHTHYVHGRSPFNDFFMCSADPRTIGHSPKNICNIFKYLCQTRLAPALFSHLRNASCVWFCVLIKYFCFCFYFQILKWNAVNNIMSSANCASDTIVEPTMVT